MILHNQPDKPFQQRLRFQRGHVVDLLHMRAHGKHGFPPRHRVRPDYRVDGFERLAHVGRGPACLGVHTEAAALCDLAELGLRVGGGQPFKKPLVRRGEAVENFVARGPEGVLWCDVSEGR